MRGDFYKQLNSDLDTARAEGLFKEERIITSAQQADITVADGSHVINFCANNYLGLANHPELIAAAKNGMDTHGFGMASVRRVRRWRPPAARAAPLYPPPPAFSHYLHYRWRLMGFHCGDSHPQQA
jgi:7-keto-8-aminopelargonate synthetase-like enzyme